MAELSTLARPYARAAFEHASAAGTLPQWSQMLAVLAEAVSVDALREGLSNPALTPEAQVSAVAGVCGDLLDERGRNFLQILAENDRLLLLPEIADQFETLKAAGAQVEQVLVTSAYPLQDDELARVQEKLEQRLNSKIQIETAVDESLIGGLLVRAGDKVIDGSLRGRLQKLADSLNS